MSSHTNVIGFKPPDEKWRKMKAAYDACTEAGLDPPKEVEKFFEGRIPDDNGVVLECGVLMKCGAATKWVADMEVGFEVDIKKLPPDVTKLRFYVSY